MLAHKSAYEQLDHDPKLNNGSYKITDHIHDSAHDLSNTNCKFSSLLFKLEYFYSYLKKTFFESISIPKIDKQLTKVAKT